MNKNQELYTAIGSILKGLKSELTDNLQNYVKLNSDFNKETSDSIQFIIDAVSDVENNLGTTKQTLIDTHVEVKSELVQITESLKKLEDGDFVDGEQFRDVTESVANNLKSLIEDATQQIGDETIHNKAQDAYFNEKLATLVESIICINSNIESLKIENIDSNTKFKSVSAYQKTNKELIKEQLEINDTFSDNLEKLSALLYTKTDGKEIEEALTSLDNKLNTLDARSKTLSEKVSNLKFGKVIDDKIKYLQTEAGKSTVNINVIHQSLGDLNELLEDNRIENISQFKSIVDVIADLEKEFIDHKSKAFDELKEKTNNVDQKVEKFTVQMADVESQVSHNQNHVHELGEQINEINEDIETVAHNMSKMKDNHKSLDAHLDDHIEKSESTSDLHESILNNHEDKFTDANDKLNSAFDKLHSQQEEFKELTKSVDDKEAVQIENFGALTGTVENTLEDLNNGVLVKKIKTDLTADTKILVKEQAEISEALIIRKTDEFIINLATNMKGAKGDTGNLVACKEWEEGDLTLPLTTVVHHCGLWQCVSETDSQPAVYSKEWMLIASGVNKVRTQLNRVNNKVVLELVTEDSAGEEKIHSMDYPLPQFMGTWDEEKDYGFYDSVVKDGHRWISKSTQPKGNPATSDDWAMFGMQGKRGAKGLKGDKGDMPSMSSVIKALNHAELNDKNPPIRRWAGLWKYNKSHQVGDLLSFDAGIWLTVNNDDGSVPPGKIENKNFVLLLRGDRGSGNGLLLDVVHSNVEDITGASSVTNMMSLSQTDYDAIVTISDSTLYIITTPLPKIMLGSITISAS